MVCGYGMWIAMYDSKLINTLLPYMFVISSLITNMGVFNCVVKDLSVAAINSYSFYKATYLAFLEALQ